MEGRRYSHNEPGIRALCSRLVRLQVALVALERPDGLLIERLLDAGLTVVAVHPNQVKAMRPRYSVAGGKSDSFDSFVLAELARTDSHRFRVLAPDSDRTKALRSMTRARDGLVRTRVGLANQLRDQLACFWPGASKVFWSVDSQIALAFLRRYPTPLDARGLGEQRLAAFLKRHGYTGRKPARELFARLRNGAEGRAGELEMQARREIVLALVSALEPIVARISELTIEIRHALDAHPDATVPAAVKARCSRAPVISSNLAYPAETPASTNHRRRRGPPGRRSGFCFGPVADGSGRVELMAAEATKRQRRIARRENVHAPICGAREERARQCGQRRLRPRGCVTSAAVRGTRGVMAKTGDFARRNRGTDTKKKVVAAAGALVGAAVVGGKLALDRRASSRHDSERAFRLYKDEPIPDGIRRIARGQLDQAHDELAGGPKRKLATAVHDTRKGFKRLRATVRLARGALGDEAYRRENVAFREAGRRLAGVRDASVLIETLDTLEKVSGNDLPGDATVKLRAQLKDDRGQALDSLKADDTLVAAMVDDIDSARTRTAAWTFDVDGFEAVEPGLRRIYRRGRNAMRRAQEEPSDPNLHDWRKRVKDLWHAEQILRPTSPKRMKKLAKRTHGLADLLGDDHDLAELRHYVATHRGCFDDRAAQVALTAVIDRRRRILQDEAFAVGPKLYRRSPGQFVKAIGRRWRKRARPPASAG